MRYIITSSGPPLICIIREALSSQLDPGVQLTFHVCKTFPFAFDPLVRSMHWFCPARVILLFSYLHVCAARPL